MSDAAVTSEFPLCGTIKAISVSILNICKKHIWKYRGKCVATAACKERYEIKMSMEYKYEQDCK